MVKKR